MKQTGSFLCLLLLGFAACKSTKSTVQQIKYEENLTTYRVPVQAVVEEPVEPVVSQQPPVELTGHLATEIDSVLSIIVARNQEREYWDGYTIQIYNGLDRNAAYSARKQMDNLDLNLPVKIEYHQPNYKVKVGLYFEQLLAYIDYRYLKEEFSSALLLPEKIKLSDYVGAD